MTILIALLAAWPLWVAIALAVHVTRERRRARAWRRTTPFVELPAAPPPSWRQVLFVAIAVSLGAVLAEPIWGPALDHMLAPYPRRGPAAAVTPEGPR